MLWLYAPKSWPLACGTRSLKSILFVHHVPKYANEDRGSSISHQPHEPCRLLQSKPGQPVAQAQWQTHQVPHRTRNSMQGRLQEPTAGGAPAYASRHGINTHYICRPVTIYDYKTQPTNEDKVFVWHFGASKTGHAQCMSVRVVTGIPHTTQS